MEAFLSELLPRILGAGVTYKLHNFGSKQALLKKLRPRLMGYSEWITADYRIIVLIDEDREDCKALKQRIIDDIEGAGLTHKSAVAQGAPFQCAARIVVEELEAWLLGDVAAVREAYPRVPASLASKAGFRDPDAIRGGTWEAFERILQRAGYYKTGLPKVEVATNIAPHVDPGRNTSKSFIVFRDLMMGL